MLQACGRWFALTVDPCLGDRLTGGTALRLGSSLYHPRHQLFPIEERSAAVAGRSSLMSRQAPTPLFPGSQNTSNRGSTFSFERANSPGLSCARNTTICRFGSDCPHRWLESGPRPDLAADKERAD